MMMIYDHSALNLSERDGFVSFSRLFVKSMVWAELFFHYGK